MQREPSNDRSSGRMVPTSADGSSKADEERWGISVVVLMRRVGVSRTTGGVGHAVGQDADKSGANIR